MNPEGASSLTGVSHAPSLQPLLDRTGWARAQLSSVEELWQRPSARLLPVDHAGHAMRPSRCAGTAGVDFEPQRHILLGCSEGGRVPWFAVRVADGEVPAADAVGLRESQVTALDKELLEAATAILAWHDRGGASGVPCERCGAATRVSPGGFSRHCVACGAEVFPRTDPAMIVAVLDEQDRILLAHQASWPEGRVSVLAGFLEAGESAEHAVVREVAEEAGLVVRAAHYVASQPWPFPRSLMLGFVARSGGEPRVDGQEIAWADWYSRDRYDRELAGGVITGPSANSIASRLIAQWRDGSLPNPDSAPSD